MTVKKKAKPVKKSKKNPDLNPHSPDKVEKLLALGAASVETIGGKSKKRTKEEDLRLKQVLENPSVKVELGEARLPLEKDPISSTIHEGLMDYKIEGTHLRLLGMVDPTKTPTVEQRVAMAKRLNEVGPFLPRYIKSVELRPSSGITKEDIAAATSDGTDDPVVVEARAARKARETVAAKEPVASRTAAVKKVLAEPIEGGIPLKKICAEVDIDPKDARRCLRSKKIEKPGGRWEWTAERAKEIKAILCKERDDIIRSKL